MLHTIPARGTTGRVAVVMLALTAQIAVFGTMAHAAGFDCDRFKKNDDGTWGAVQTTEIGGPTGRIDFTPGEVYKEGELRKGLDIVKLLNANCVK